MLAPDRGNGASFTLKCEKASPGKVFGYSTDIADGAPQAFGELLQRHNLIRHQTRKIDIVGQTSPQIRKAHIDCTVSCNCIFLNRHCLSGPAHEAGM